MTTQIRPYHLTHTDGRHADAGGSDDAQTKLLDDDDDDDDEAKRAVRIEALFRELREIARQEAGKGPTRDTYDAAGDAAREAGK